jgi:putative transposase
MAGTEEQALHPNQGTLTGGPVRLRRYDETSDVASGFGFRLTTRCGDGSILVRQCPAPSGAVLDEAIRLSSRLSRYTLLTERGTTPVIKQNPTRKRLHPVDKNAYKGRNIIERAFSRLKDWRRAATRYDRLARNFRSTIALVSMVIWWI